jgi:general secretion pathway protein B
MSYILDALRRSQAERERGQVPGLNAQPAATASAPPERRSMSAPWVLAGLTIVAGLAAAVWLWRAPSPGAAAPLAAAPSTLPAPAARPAPTPAALPVVVSAPTPLPPAPAVAPVLVAASPGAVSPPPAGPLPAAVTPTATSPSAPRLPTLSELSAEQRRELPPLVMGGSIWSESALSRFVIVNGQVVREGEAAAPGVTVERIGPKAVVLRWRDARFEVPL